MEIQTSRLAFIAWIIGITRSNSSSIGIFLAPGRVAVSYTHLTLPTKA